MSRVRYERVQRLFAEARALPPDRRAAFLSSLDPDLRSEVESLLGYDVSDERIPLDADRIVPPLPPEALNGAAAPEPRDTLGHYRIIRALGHGGMGAVYLAEDRELGRQVALKIVRPARLFFPGAVERFRREARAASRLEHPHICPVYDVGEDAGVQYMAMRLVQGETLAEKIQRLRSRSGAGHEPTPPVSELLDATQDGTATAGKRAGRKPPMAVVALFEKVARALHVAHEAGLVHRDIKPGNIMVAADGEPVILDFGLALDLEGDDQSLTMSGDCVGTPLFMSPEQVGPQRDSVDRRTDVYSLAVTCYEALTLRNPFDGPTRDETYRRILGEDPPPVHKVDRSLPKDLGVVLATAMDKDRERRYATALDFAEDLMRVQELRPVLARPVSLPGRIARWTKRNTAAALTFLLVSLGLGVALLVTLVALGERDAALLRADRHVAFSLVQEGERLWPRRAEEVGDADAWLDNARDLMLRSPEHRDLLDDLVGRDRAEQVELLADIGRLRQLIAEVSHRRELALTIAQRSIHDHRTLWEGCIADIARHPAYAGLVIQPQVGLVPLGKDRQSRLWEFWHVASGTRPHWKGDVAAGRAEIGEESGIVLVLLPGGTFTMGAQPDEPQAPNFDELARADEKPPHAVTLAPFFLSKFETTQGQWLRTMGSNPSYHQATPASTHRGNGWALVDFKHPVTLINRHDATEAARRLDLVLPTEAQWEYAARGGTSWPWWFACDLESFHEALAQQREDGLLANVADRTFGQQERNSPSDDLVDDGHAIHASVDALAANAFGICGTVGNVLEWCRDRYGASYARFEPRPGDGLRGDSDPGLRFGTLRGAGFQDPPKMTPVSRRWPDDPRDVTYDGGVRFARAIDR